MTRDQASGLFPSADPSGGRNPPGGDAPASAYSSLGSATTCFCLSIRAVSMAGAILLILEMNRPIECTIRVSPRRSIRRCQLLHRIWIMSTEHHGHYRTYWRGEMGRPRPSGGSDYGDSCEAL